jgi:hypothetical protein
MRFLRFSVRWGIPPLLAVVGFAATYLIFYPGLEGARVTDGSARSFNEMADRINDGKLLENASPLERVAWLMEICAQPRGLKRDHTLFEAIQRLQPGDFAAAITDLPELSKWLTAMDADLRAEIIQACIERWLEVDEAGLLRWLPVAQKIVESGSLNLPKIGERDLGALYLALARRKPGWMFENLEQLGPKLGRGAALQAAIQAAVEEGSPQAGQWLAKFKGTPEYGPARMTYINTLAKSDPEQALTFTLSEMPGNPALAQRIITDCAAQRPELATSLLDKLKKEEREKIMMPLGEVIAANPAYDPFQWLEEQVKAHPEIYDPNRSYMISALANRDPARAMDWIKKFPETKQDELAQKILGTWTQNDPKAMLAWLNENPGPSALKNMPSFGQLPYVDPEGFAQWVAKLPPGDVQRKARYEQALGALDKGQIAEATRAFPADSPEMALGNQTNGFAWRMAKANPQEAVRWVQTLPPGGVQEQAVAGVMGQWMERAPIEAAQWVETLPDGRLRDSGAGVLARGAASQDFERANEWLAEIRDPQIRDATAVSIFEQWQARRPAQTQEWLRTLPGVSETVRNRLLRSP